MFGEKLKALRLKNQLTMDELAKNLNKQFNTTISKSMISRWESGKADPSITNVKYLIKYFNVDYTYFVGKDPSNVIQIADKHLVNIPIIGEIAMGTPITAEQNIIGYTTEVYDDMPTDELFALRCKGHSMEPTIPDGAIAILKQAVDVEDDEIAAVQVDHDEAATLKRIQHVGNTVLLKPDNPAYPTLTLDKDHQGRIIGKLIEVKIRFDN